MTKTRVSMKKKRGRQRRCGGGGGGGIERENEVRRSEREEKDLR